MRPLPCRQLWSGLKLVADLNDQSGRRIHSRLAHHPDLAIDLARFIRAKVNAALLIEASATSDRHRCRKIRTS
jgi:hypothetical protein